MKALPTDQALPISNSLGADEEMLTNLQRETFDYFLHEMNHHNGLIADKTKPASPASITVIGMGLSAYVVGVERGLLSREHAIQRVLTVLRFFHSSHQGPEVNATGHHGFFYHFLDMHTGRRAWNCELSTIDTTFFIAGALTAANYFTSKNKEETEIRELADSLYHRIDWRWALNGGTTVSHGWKPETGFLQYRWDNRYSEALLLYALALGSPTFAIGEEGYLAWTSTFEWREACGIEYLYAGPLFIHQLSHLWLDFRDIRDDFNRKVGIDYFENSRRATYIHRQYAIDIRKTGSDKPSKRN